MVAHIRSKVAAGLLPPSQLQHSQLSPVEDVHIVEQSNLKQFQIPQNLGSLCIFLATAISLAQGYIAAFGYTCQTLINTLVPVQVRCIDCTSTLQTGLCFAGVSLRCNRGRDYLMSPTARNRRLKSVGIFQELEPLLKRSLSYGSDLCFEEPDLHGGSSIFSLKWFGPSLGVACSINGARACM